MDTEKDSYLTVEGEAEAVYRQLSSKFFAYAYHVESEQQIKEHLDALRKRYYDATHHCYAYRLGHDGATFRANDDGTKLGVPGLIQAYRESTAAVLEHSTIVRRTVDCTFEVAFSYTAMNDIMRIVKDMQPRIVEQRFDNLCSMRLAIRSSHAERLAARLSDVEGATVERI